MEHKKSKLTLKGIDESTGIPFIKEIHSLDEVKTSGTYIVIARNATSEENGFPKINGKTDCCFCCEANLVVNCCYNDDESQSTNTYGQELTISDKESNTTGTYKRTVGSAGCSEWLMVATGNIELIAQNNDIVKAYNEVSANYNAAIERINKAETIALRSYNTVLESATARFDRIEENEVTINAGEIDSTPTTIVYYKPMNKFVAADNEGNYWDTWEGTDAYMSGSSIRKDKVYLCGNYSYIWDEALKYLTPINNDYIDCVVEHTYNAYIANSGNIMQTTSNYSYTNPIFLNKGDSIKVSVYATTAICILSETTINGLYRIPVISAKAGVNEFEYTALYDMYIAVSGRPDDMVIKKKAVLKKCSEYSRSETITSVFAPKFYAYTVNQYRDGVKKYCSTEIDIVGKNIQAISIDATINETATAIALVNEIDKNGNLIAIQFPYNEDRKIRCSCPINENTAKIIINANVAENIGISLLSGNIIDNNAKTTSTILEPDYSEKYSLLARPHLPTFIDYKTSEVKNGNGFWYMVEIPVDRFDAIEYKAQLRESDTNVALLSYLNENGEVIKYIHPNTSSEIVEGVSETPISATKVAIAIFRNYLCEISFLKNKKDNTLRSVNGFHKQRFLLTAGLDSVYYNLDKGAIVNGNNVLFSKIVEVSEFPSRMFEYNIKTLVSSNAVAAITYLNEKDSAIGWEAPYDKDGFHNGVAIIPEDTVKVMFTTLSGYIRSQEIYRYRANIDNNTYETFAEAVEAGATGIVKVGKTLITNNVSYPIFIQQEQDAFVDTKYYDANSSITQYDVCNATYPSLPDCFMNKLQSVEIDFTPEDDGYNRMIMGKDSDDRFYIAYYASSRKGAAGAGQNTRIEVTTDFVNFTTIWKSYNNSGDGATYEDWIGPKGYQAKELPNGNILLLVRGYEASTANTITGYFTISHDLSTIQRLQYTDFDGNTVPMNLYSDNYAYDWHIAVADNRVLLSEYGQKTQGKVWYSEDGGNTFRQVFLMDTHFNDGVSEDDEDYPVTQTHIHGVMLDEYSNRMFVIAGEINDNIFYSDMGIETTDSDWSIINIRNQIILPQMRNMQVVNGWSFPQGLVFGSDCLNIGAFFRLNRTPDGGYSQIEVAHEAKPNAFTGTRYCAAEMSRKDKRSPVLMCITRENNETTEDKNEDLNRLHSGRVVATYDGIKFFEVWKDDTFGEHTVYIPSTATMETRKFAYCTRGMNAWQLNKSDDVVIKYSGRDYYFIGAEDYTSAYGDFSSKVRIIKNASRWM